MNVSRQRGWEVRTVDSLGTVRGGKRLPKGRSLLDVPTPHPYIRVTDMHPGGVDTSDLRYVPVDVAPSIRSYRIFRDDIFVSVAGTLGIVGRIPASLHGANLTENADRITAISCDVDYLMYALLSEPIQREIDAIRTVGAQPKLALGRIKQFEIGLPTVEAEQRRVSTALRDVDTQIATIEHMIVKKQAIKRGLMQQLLTRGTRLPGFAAEWSMVRLRDAGSTYSGLGGKSKQDFGTGSATFVTFMEVMAGARLLGRRLERVSVRPNERQNRVLRGDVLFNGSSETPEEVALAAVVDYDPTQTTYLNSFCFGYRLKTRDRIDPTYLAYFFRSVWGREAVSVLAQGATRYNIAKTKLMEVAPLLPPLDEQRAIVGVLRDAESEIEALNARLEKARAIKAGMMQELLTGRVRLPAEVAS